MARGSRRRGRFGRIAALAIATLAVAAAPAFAAAIPGATYTGVAADGASVGFTVSSDGTLVDSYRIGNSQGDHCTFYAAGDQGVWQGAPINGGAFRYDLGDGFDFRGAFTGPQSATGTFQFHNSPSGGAPACDTGVVGWTATTTATPTSGPGGGGGNSQGGGQGSGGGAGNGQSAGGGRAQFATRVVLRRLAHGRLGGSVSSSKTVCVAGRTMILWRGSRRIGSTWARARGRYSFARSASLRGQRVRVTVLARSVTAGICAAGSSKFIRA